ncbi:enoyl-CoA hydratase/isomerase family protein [Tuberibacillus sp. Marseille-P3662]|uniref:enoyl-CoA hydratase/isomerase family protein n=1 Tax=Tuberibacillus sp. Marseille-P3662 TaxID=1965358 RepID=UPI000A1C8C6F|nr:enoyl-CoA hydratase [Tuberibacillus sp. Marseille-P3662]
MTHQHVLVNVNDHVMSLTLNRPDSLNAFSPDMMDGLKEAFQRAEHDDDIRAVVLSGAGRSFSAGGDVKGMGAANPVGVYEHIGELNELIQQMTELGKPIIAAIHGFTAGAGVCLAMACDQIVASEDSQFVLSFSKVGLISDGGGLFFLPRTLGTFRAKELLFNAEPIDAQKAQQWGMVNFIYSSDEWHDKAIAYANKLAQGPSQAYGFIKKIANRSLTADLKEILEVERTTQGMVSQSDDHKEGVAAFKDKRHPHFTGK